MSRLSLSGKRWNAVRALVLDRDGRECTSCGATDDLTVDHTKPLALFDDDDWAAEREYDPDHLITLCNPCNGRKSDRVVARANWVNRKWIARIS